jgi:enoyl-CoA hydratase/carnithine racemase
MALVEYTRKDRIGYITFNRPEKLNAFSDDVSKEFADTLHALNDDARAFIGILSGNGRAFCSGADVKQRQLRPKEEVEKLGQVAGREGAMWPHAMFRSPKSKPIIAAVHGYAYGVGLKIALYCDLLVAAKGCKFQVTEVPRGINGVPFWTLLKDLGLGTFANDVCLTGRAWLAEEAFASGMVNRLAEPGKHLQEAEALAQTVLENPPLAVRAVVEARRRVLEEGEVKSYGIRPRGLHLSDDFRESARAFVEKRKAVFHGR